MRPPTCFSLFRASTRGPGAMIRPRLISNWATRWIALSWRSASAGRAQVCQYVVATIEGDQQRHREPGDPDDLLVHRCTAVAAARFETRSSRPSMTKLATIEEPP